MAIYFTSDWHLGHKNILGYCNRPFESIEENDAALIDAVASVLTDDDILYHLGDVSFPSVRRYQSELSSLPGKHFLVAGNHDSVWHGSHHRKPESSVRYEAAGFHEINDGTPGKEWKLSYEALGWPGTGWVMLNHFPSEGDSQEEDRYLGYRPTYQGIIICGHVHDAWRFKTLPNGTRNVNVGVDVWGYRPVSSQELYEVIIAEGVSLQWQNRRS